MKRKIWLFFILILIALGIFSVLRVITYEPIITYKPVVKSAEVDEATIAALALYSSQQYPTDDVNIATRSINTGITRIISPGGSISDQELFFTMIASLRLRMSNSP